jgi:hypothetical protein
VAAEAQQVERNSKKDLVTGPIRGFVPTLSWRPSNDGTTVLRKLRMCPASRTMPQPWNAVHASFASRTVKYQPASFRSRSAFTWSQVSRVEAKQVRRAWGWER